MNPDHSKLKEWIYRYEIAHFIVERRMHVKIRDMMPEELTVEQFKTLRFLRHSDRCTASDLSESFCVGKSTVTAIISRLSDKGLIQRVPDEKDRRVIHLELTDEGERLCDLMEEKVQSVLASIMEHFDAKEAVAFIETYEKLAEKVKQL